jgi:hypothetical protein
MEVLRSPHPHRRKQTARTSVVTVLGLLTLLGAVIGACGCARTHPPRLDALRLSEAQTFPYFRLYWAGPRFAGRPLTAVDGRQGYNSGIGDSVYYGDCASGKGALGGGGSCALPLQITTVIYRLHSNAPLGSQRNVLLRGVPATIYDNGRSIELYSGRVAIDVSSDAPTHALLAAGKLQPLNAPPESGGTLPAPVYCPGLTGTLGAELRNALERLPGHPCQHARAALAARGHLADGPIPRY